MSTLTARVSAEQLPAVLAALLRLEDSAAKLPSPIRADLAYLPHGSGTMSVHGGAIHTVTLEGHTRERQRMLFGYPPTWVVELLFYFSFTAHYVPGTFRGEVRITKLEDDTFALKIMNLNSRNMPPQLADFPIELQPQLAL